MKKLLLCLLLVGCNAKDINFTNQDDLYYIDTGETLTINYQGEWTITGTELTFTDSIVIPNYMIANRCGESSTRYQLSIFNDTSLVHLGNIIASGQGTLPANHIDTESEYFPHYYTQQVTGFEVVGRGMIFASDYISVSGYDIIASNIEPSVTYHDFVLKKGDDISCAFRIKF